MRRRGRRNGKENNTRTLLVFVVVYLLFLLYYLFFWRPSYIFSSQSPSPPVCDCRPVIFTNRDQSKEEKERSRKREATAPNVSILELFQYNAISMY